MKTLHYTKIAVVAHWVFLKVCAHNITIDCSASLKVGRIGLLFLHSTLPHNHQHPCCGLRGCFRYVCCLAFYYLHTLNENFLQNAISADCVAAGHCTLGKSLQGTSPQKYHKIAILMVFKTTYMLPNAADF